MATTAAAQRKPAIEALPESLAAALADRPDRDDLDMIREAYELAAEAHSGQYRASGEPFINHSVEVAVMLASMALDTASVVSALVHDVVEDTPVTLAEIRQRFGDDIAIIVDGVTKFGSVRYKSSTERQAENYRKLLLSIAEDARVILVKLADRLHNMRTLEHLPREKQKSIARETREIYAPLAHRLGMGAIKWELEDLAFKFLEPDDFRKLKDMVDQSRPERERHVLDMQGPLEGALKQAGIAATVTGRPKHLWSIHRKMVGQNRSYDDIYDLMALRVITESDLGILGIYSALGIVHGNWTPILERFHDYVAIRKSNGYQSVHTTVYGARGRRYEIQIRTPEMDATAEWGVAAHWKYKEKTRGSKLDDDISEWFRGVLERLKQAKDSKEFMDDFRMDLFDGEIFVFTPKGHVKQLPAGATAIDFAFAMHTEVGLRCAGARVNGRITPLSRPLEHGDSVEIITKPRQRPTRDWLGFVKTARAQQKIRQWIRRAEYDSALRFGQELFHRELRKARRPKPTKKKLKRVARKLGFHKFDQVLAALAKGDVSPSAVIRALYPEEDPSDVVKRSPSALERIAERIRKSNRGVVVQGMDHMLTYYSKCCEPVPGDKVTGYVTRGRGVAIHRRTCSNLLNLDKDKGRRVPVQWRAERDDRFFVHLYMEGNDRRGLLSDVSRTISETATDIRHADMQGSDGDMTARYIVEVQDLKHLQQVMNAARRVKGVTSVIRRESIGKSDLKGRTGS